MLFKLKKLTQFKLHTIELEYNELIFVSAPQDNICFLTTLFVSSVAIVDDDATIPYSSIAARQVFKVLLYDKIFQSEEIILIDAEVVHFPPHC